MQYRIDKLHQDDFHSWSELFSAYCQFYAIECPEDKLTQVWQWLFNPEHPLQGLGAYSADNTLVGLLHYQAIPLSLFGSDTGYLSDLYIAPEHRCQGIARLLQDAFTAIGKRANWPFCAWLTQEENSQARALYDQNATATDFRYYVQDLSDQSH